MSEKKIVRNDVRKALLQQQMVIQRQTLQEKVRPIIQTSKRVQNLFSTQNKPEKNKKRIIAVTSVAVFLAILGRRRGGWLGQAARYVIINYPGLFHKFMK